MKMKQFLEETKPARKYVALIFAGLIIYVLGGDLGEYILGIMAIFLGAYHGYMVRDEEV